MIRYKSEKQPMLEGFETGSSSEVEAGLDLPYLTHDFSIEKRTFLTGYTMEFFKSFDISGKNIDVSVDEC